MKAADRRSTLEDIPRITYTGDGIPGDPLDVALVGTELELAFEQPVGDSPRHRHHVRFGNRTKSIGIVGLTEKYVIEGFQKVREGRNGGDPWCIDGNLYVGIIAKKMTP